MPMINYRPTSILILLASLVCACSKEDESPSRTFLMGFATVPYGSSESLDYVYDRLSVEADIVSHHFDNGVPWEEALANEELPVSVLQDWEFRRTRIAAPHKTYVSVTPINASHNGLANALGGSLPSPWDRYSFRDEQVKTAYLNYCRKVIDYFKPDYFAMAVEVNLLYKSRPDLWSEYLSFHKYIYANLKAEYSQLPVFSTIAGAPLLKGFLPDNDHVIQRLAAMQVLEMSDNYAISFYPPDKVFEEADTWPLSTFHELFSLSTKPVIIAETAFAARPYVASGSPVFTSDAVKQKLFVDALLAASSRWRAEFVIWLTLRDHDGSDPVAAHDHSRIGSGLYDGDGNPRPALNSWRTWFNKKIEIQ